MTARPAAPDEHPHSPTDSLSLSDASDMNASSIERSPHIPPQPIDDPAANPSRSSSSPAAPFSHLASTAASTSTPGARPVLPHHRSSLDSRPSSATGRGGCWTCRLRRKKCDEQREEGDSCRTCRRLQLNCLGWGPRRPDWMRDKEAVANYKAEIKAHLLRLGLIRGQPRSSLLGSPIGPSAPYTRTSGSSAHGSGTHALDGPGVYPYRFDESSAMAFPSGMPTVPGNAPPASFAPEPQFDYDLALFGAHGPGSGSSAPAGLAGDVFDGGAHANFDMRSSMRMSDPDESVRREHVAYYFTNVRGMHFLFQCKIALEATHAAIMQEPQSPLVNCIAALANLHILQHASSRDGYPDAALAQYFYNEAAYQLEGARRHAQYTEADALSAVHLVSYAVAAGGGTVRATGTSEWMPFLEVACEWLTQTGMHVEENPRLAIINMSLAGAFCAKLTMCMDIFMAITLQQPPRLLALYRRLLINGNTSSPTPGGTSASTGSYELYVPLLVGCTESVLLAFAEIAALAHWKARETRNGTMSARELIMRGTAIERALRNHADAASSAAFLGVGGPDGNTALPPMQTSFAQMTPDMTRRLSAAIFQETALLYLNTVLSGSNPGVPEISSSTSTIAQLLNQLPPGSPMDSALVLPLSLAGFLADTPAVRDTLRKRLLAIDDASANMRQIVSVMQDVWARRDSTHVPVEWREVMHERGLSLLFI
ncbi:hypothetical protein FA95DRAFT_1592820 [Auriscalpium vulgare]|uniref:Uncharacterized protein n=1 Tax=Auriscalpium vulgare TaxID=40419 RepID=A0ACB8S7M9_9AGAM|nr:hypothetical protein FA95DRAFT_1592820 [Auriscalpium vulgare]